MRIIICINVFTVSPIEVSILGKTSRITAGKKYDLLCQSVGSRPPAHITWWLDDRRLESAKETVREKTFFISLEFTFYFLRPLCSSSAGLGME